MVSTGSFWSTWQLAPQITLALLVIEYLYLRQVLKMGPASTKRQRRFFLSGLATIAFAVCTPFGAYSATLFWCHMVQHVTLMMISGPLLVLGTPSSFRPKNQIFRSLTNPVVSWLLYAGVMIGVHLPAPHQLIMNNPWIHSYVEVPTYVIVAYLFYFNLLDRNLTDRVISPAMSVISLFLMMVPETLTGFFIYIAPKSIYGGMFEVLDQRRGGSIMWSGGMIVDTVWLSFAVYHWIKSEELASKKVDEEMANEG
jgi:cytochrome c oxidase assembly factor CtaG